MNTRRIGSLNVSVVGLGCNNFGWRIDYAQTERVVHAALDAGVTFFDTADVYSKTQSEDFLGRALMHRRHEAVIATKFGRRINDTHRGGHPEHVRQAANASLKRLRIETLDLFQFHSPDPLIPIADTLGALNDLVREGKVREIGCSNVSASQIQEASDRVTPDAARFVSVQNEYSLLHRDPEDYVLPLCTKQGLAFIPFHPLSHGILTGKYSPKTPYPVGTRLSLLKNLSPHVAILRAVALSRYAQKHNCTLLDLSVSWLLSHPEVASVIAGATSPAQVQMNALTFRQDSSMTTAIANLDLKAPEFN